MLDPSTGEYWTAAVTKVESLEAMDAWEVVDCTENMNVCQSSQAFKLKCFPNGLIKKFKARFCARGDQQIECINNFESCAPVV